MNLQLRRKRDQFKTGGRVQEVSAWFDKRGKKPLKDTWYV